MSVFGKHIDLITELFKELFIDFGVEIFLDCNMKAFIHSLMYGAESSLGNLWTDFQVRELNF